MKTLSVFLGYLKWHYSKAIKSMFVIWQNFLRFLANFFSLKLMLTNLFDHWKRMSDPYPKHFSFKAYLFSFIVNVITRIVGMLMRLVILILGSLICLIFIFCLPIILILWLVLPFIIIALLGSGLYLIF